MKKTIVVHNDWSLMDFDVDTSSSEDRKRVVVKYLVERALKNDEPLHDKTQEPTEIPSDMIGSFYF